MKKILLLLVTLSAVHCESFYYQKGEKVYLTPQTQNSPALRTLESSSQITYYKNQYGQKMGVKNQIIIKLKEKASLEDLLKRHNVTLIKALSDTLYLVETSDLKESVFEKAAALYEDDATLIAQPNFARKRVLR